MTWNFHPNFLVCERKPERSQKMGCTTISKKYLVERVRPQSSFTFADMQISECMAFALITN